MADTINVTWVGMDKLAALLASAGPQIVPALAQALTEEAQLGFAASQQIVPRKTGTLAGSGQVMPAEIDGTAVSVQLGYGGAASAYAWFVHENPNAHHGAGKSYKYLEAPMVARVPNMGPNIAKRLDRILGTS